MVKLSGQRLKEFLEFLGDSYPEHLEDLGGLNLCKRHRTLEIATDSLLFEIWQEFDTFCG